LIINHFKSDKAYCINCTPFKLDYNPEEYLNEETTDETIDFTEIELQFEKIDYNYLVSINVVQCGCPCKYGEFNQLDTTSFYKKQCLGPMGRLIEWNTFNCFLEKSCSTGNIYRGKLSSNSTSSTTTTTAPPTTTATDFTSSSNVTLTSSNIENQKIDSGYLTKNTTEKYDYEVFTTKQPEISERNSVTEIVSSQINDKEVSTTGMNK
jgi:hypothetical protein